MPGTGGRDQYIYCLFSHRTAVKYLVPINCPVLTFNSVIKLYPQKALEYVAKGLGEQWVHLSWGSDQVAEAPERLIETGPSGSPRPDAVKRQPLWGFVSSIYAE